MDKFYDLIRSNRFLLGLGLFFSISLAITYSNHFDNGFQFDDTHTIVGNQYIRDLHNLPLFFTDIATFGTMPSNRGYRPVVTTLNAIDFWRGRNEEKGNEMGRLNPRNFHTSIMFWYLFQCVLMFFMFKRILDLSLNSSWNGLVSLLTVAWYAHHAANAETINYIIARSDSFSTFCVVAALTTYMSAVGKKYHLYLIPFIIGIFTKETGVVFLPILFFYILLFEQDLSLGDFFKWRKDKGKQILAGFRKTLPSIAIGIPLFLFCRLAMTPTVHLLAKSSTSRINYFFTQSHVINHYLQNFLLPLNLSADPDFAVMKNLLDTRIIFGMLLLIGLCIAAFAFSRKRTTMPISFGLIWFYAALFPTSSFHPLGQIANDHRTFFPYVGLVLSSAWGIFLVFRKYYKEISSRQIYPVLIAVGVVFVIAGHAYGTHRRNEVWSSSESLWKDVTEKSPNNGRGLMNYALSLMNRGEYEKTLDYFERALKLMPYYSYLHINMGVLKNAMGLPEEAEKYYKSALRYDPTNAEAYFYYAQFLFKKKRTDEALALLEKGLKISPGHIGMKKFYERVKNGPVTDEQKMNVYNQRLNAKPSVADYINLSLLYFNAGNYEKCIEACEEAIKLNPESAEAYNNICISYIRLGKIELAIEACEKSVKLNPDFRLARNNLRWAKSLLGK